MTDMATIDRNEWKHEIDERAERIFSSGVRSVAFYVYRRGDISSTHTEVQRAAPDEVQFDGVIFTDGTTVIHWNTAVHSTAVFDTLSDLLDIHGHPEYDTEFVFEGEE